MEISKVHSEMYTVYTLPTTNIATQKKQGWEINFSCEMAYFQGQCLVLGGIVYIFLNKFNTCFTKHHGYIRRI